MKSKSKTKRFAVASDLHAAAKEKSNEQGMKMEAFVDRILRKVLLPKSCKQP